MVLTFLVAAVQAPYSYRYLRGSHQRVGEWYQVLNAIGNGVGYLLILSVVLTFIYRATAQREGRRFVRTAVTVGAILLVVISFAIHHRAGAALGSWMAPWTRDIQFGSAILDLAAWGALVASRDRDSRLLLLTGGLGIMFAGEAVGAAIKSIAIPLKSLPLLYTGHIFGQMADVAFLYVWWQAFRAEGNSIDRNHANSVANGS
jgi:hypothetical protein